tara:strand:- start:85 stop:1065 length:981 start_codon:yes stop_codon:yes gene_type:complete
MAEPQVIKNLKNQIAVYENNLANTAQGSLPRKAAQKRIRVLKAKLAKAKKKPVGKTKPAEKNAFLDVKKNKKKTKPKSSLSKTVESISKFKKRKKTKKASKLPPTPPSLISKAAAKPVSSTSKKAKTPKPTTGRSLLPEQLATKVVKKKPRNISDTLASERGNVEAWSGSKYKPFSKQLKNVTTPVKRKEVVAPLPKTKPFPKKKPSKNIFRDVTTKKREPIKYQPETDAAEGYDPDGKTVTTGKKRKSILDAMFGGFKSGDFSEKDTIVRNPFTGGDMDISYEYPEDPDSVEAMYRGGSIKKGMKRTKVRKRAALRGHRKERCGG